MALRELSRKINDGAVDVERMTDDIREVMMKHHGKPNIKEVLREEVKEYLRKKYPFALDRLIEYTEMLYSSLYGLGIIEKYLKDPEVTDIHVNGTKIMYKKAGVKIDAAEEFPNEQAVRVIQDRILAPLNKSINIANPSQDAELYDGSRALLVIPPESDKPVIIIRKHNLLNVPLEELAETTIGLTKEMQEYFKKAVKDRKNIMVAGETGAGKTTFINSLGFEIQEKHVVAVLEDTREIKLHIPYVYYFKTRKGTAEARDVSYSDILKDCLRADPDRIILTEIRTPESAYELIHVLNSGHRGSMTTIHANSCLDALLRLEMLIQEFKNLDYRIIRKLISRALDIVVFLRLAEDEKGNLKGRELAEVVEIEGIDENGDYILKHVVGD
ncbi:ATPase [Caldanaerobacter subterraneus subsp. yonseiensis KB-1]|uniref:ATPase n=1 Tax=Caldanaerobacter subterraneus subsp. yonseiensis KB-1 TaxID=1388761 RepID=U5CR74_CALSX|nr:ATPase, T2SS/T4P/T4SS family [Caldanaerobacter subterraneus]ERM92463.1 ATPase [Caldanaerobacter subterraneus subsp. yonseiensis KB-1]